MVYCHPVYRVWLSYAFRRSSSFLWRRDEYCDCHRIRWQHRPTQQRRSSGQRLVFFSTSDTFERGHFPNLFNRSRSRQCHSKWTELSFFLSYFTRIVRLSNRSGACGWYCFPSWSVIDNSLVSFLPFYSLDHWGCHRDFSSASIGRVCFIAFWR